MCAELEMVNVSVARRRRATMDALDLAYALLGGLRARRDRARSREIEAAVLAWRDGHAPWASPDPPKRGPASLEGDRRWI